MRLANSHSRPFLFRLFFADGFGLGPILSISADVYRAISAGDNDPLRSRYAAEVPELVIMVLAECKKACAGLHSILSNLVNARATARLLPDNIGQLGVWRRVGDPDHIGHFCSRLALEVLHHLESMNSGAVSAVKGVSASTSATNLRSSRPPATRS
jgi:hypothetical protein